MHRLRFGVGDRARAYVLEPGHHLREGIIHPIDDTGLRTQIGRQLQRFEHDVAYALGARLQEQPDLGFAKAVDRLHRIADGEQRAAVIRRPARGQLRDQFELADRGVLEFIDQRCRIW